jgi:hypothetical protein
MHEAFRLSLGWFGDDLLAHLHPAHLTRVVKAGLGRKIIVENQIQGRARINEHSRPRDILVVDGYRSIGRLAFALVVPVSHLGIERQTEHAFASDDARRDDFRLSKRRRFGRA